MFSRLFSSRVMALCEAGAVTMPVNALFKDKSYALLYFGAAWSPACQEFSPRLEAFRAQHAAAKQFEVLFISLDHSEEAFHAYLAQREASTTVPDHTSAVLPAMAYEDALLQGPVIMGDNDTSTIPTVLVFEVRTQRRERSSSLSPSSGSTFEGSGSPSASATSAAPRFADAADTELVFRLVSRRGCEHVESDPEAVHFPWAHPLGADAEVISSRKQGRRAPLALGAVAVLSAVAVFVGWR